MTTEGTVVGVKLWERLAELTTRRLKAHLDPVRTSTDLFANSLYALGLAVDELRPGHALDTVLVQMKFALRT